MKDLEINKNSINIFNKYDIYSTEQLLQNILSFSDSSSFKYRNMTEKKSNNFNKEILFSLFPYNNIPISLFDTINIKNFYFKSGDAELDVVLEGGFQYGKIYEINGPSLSGKTTLINSIIRNNIFKIFNIKILFLSSILGNLESDLINNENLKKIKLIDDFFIIKDIINILNNLSDINSFNLIIIDSLSVVLSNDVKIDNETINEFIRILNKLAYEFNICIIYTALVKKLKNEVLVDISDVKNPVKYIVRIYKDILPIQTPLKIAKISLYKIEQKNVSIKYYARIISNNLINRNAFFELNYSKQ
jgi:archaellum biogenesis ATPase FlaH